MYVRGPQHSITGGGSPPSIFKWGGKYPPTLPGSTPMVVEVFNYVANPYLLI